MGARRPSNAVPTRTCVAPLRTAASRSLLIPAEMASRRGCALRTRSDSSAQPVERAVGVGADRRRPPSRPSRRSSGARRSRSARAGSLSAITPPRSGSSSRLTCTNTPERLGPLAPRAAASARARGQLCAVDRMHRVGVADARCAPCSSAAVRRGASAGRPARTARSASSRDLGPRLLILALADVEHAQPGQRCDVGRRIGLGDRDERHFARVATGRIRTRRRSGCAPLPARRPTPPGGRRRARSSSPKLPRFVRT